MSKKHHKDGNVFLEYGLPAKGAAVGFCGKGFGGTESRLDDSHLIIQQDVRGQGGY